MHVVGDLPNAALVIVHKMRFPALRRLEESQRAPPNHACGFKASERDSPQAGSLFGTKKAGCFWAAGFRSSGTRI